MFIGENYGNVFFYENIGDSFEYQYSLVSEHFSDIDVGYRSAPDFIDLNLDGSPELFLGSHAQNIQVYNKIYSDSMYEFRLNECVDIPYFGLNTKPDLYYLGSELKMLTGLSTGGFLYAGYESILIGDVNLDSFINIQDVIIIIEYIIMSDSQINYCSADINYESYVDILDILFIISQIID